MSGWPEIDPADLVDVDAATLVVDRPNDPATLPTLVELYPDTTDRHPDRCRCQECEGWREWDAWQESLDRRAETRYLDGGDPVPPQGWEPR